MVLGVQRLAVWLLGQVMWKEFGDAGPREALRKHSNKIKSLHISTSAKELLSNCKSRGVAV